MLWAWYGLVVVGPSTYAQSTTPVTPASPRNPEAAATNAATASVKFRGNSLFDITAAIGELKPAERASAIEARILSLANNSPEVVNELRATERNGLTEISAAGTLVRVVSDDDAAGTGRTRRQLAADQVMIIRAALETEFRERGTASILRGAGLAVLATFLLLAGLFATSRLYAWTRLRLTSAAKSWHWSSGLAALKIVSPASIAGAARTLAGIIAWLIVLLLIYAYLQYTLSLFPWTRGIADRMVHATKASVIGVASGAYDYLPNLVSVVVIVIATRLVLKLLRRLFLQLADEKLNVAGFYPEWALPTYSLLRFVLIAIAAIMVFPYLPGSGSEGFKGVSVFVGLLISIGAAPAIGNVISGVVITYMRPFRVGDRVKIADAVGDVRQKDLFVVRLRTIKNVDITIPNALVLANHIVNFSSSAKKHGLILHTTITIGYDAPWQKVHELLITAAGKVPGVMADPAPFVLQTRLDDFYVHYEINCYTDRPNDMAALYSALHTEIQNAFNAAGIEIMSPHYAAVRDGNAMAVPNDYLPKDYKAPGFALLSRVLRPGQGT